MSHQTREELELGTNTIEIEAVPTMKEVLYLAEDGTEVDDPPRELVGIAIDMGGNQVYLSLGGRQPGAIYLWLNWEDIYFVADSFDEFVHSLYVVD
ncbi:hypothetical protein EON83_30515 [bacterium]|nr:MAG: hypothetical protein EON83_30515 [bacterium]